MKYCRNCGTKILDDAKVCPSCGAAQQDDTPGTVFCRHCGSEIDADCVICPKCGKQVKDLKAEQPSIVINNSNQNQNINTMPGVRVVKKWVAFLLCLFLGFIGAHKFYEGRIGMGILYLLTFGLFGIGWVIDIIAILLKPDPYYVYR